jgi:putative FmdB family regulatory protein
MPIYEYELVEGSCQMCRGRFELNRPVDRPPLTACPLCKKPVRKCVGQFSTPTVAKPFSTIDAKKAGFTVLKRRDHGVYEKE